MYEVVHDTVTIYIHEACNQTVAASTKCSLSYKNASSVLLAIFIKIRCKRIVARFHTGVLPWKNLSWKREN